MTDADAKPSRLRRTGEICLVALAACALGELLHAGGGPVGRLFGGMVVGIAVALAAGTGGAGDRAAGHGGGRVGGSGGGRR